MTAPVNPHTQFATTNFSLSGSSGLYDRARPDYPIEALNLVYSLLPPTSTSTSIVELGSGTGLFTRMLLSGLPAASQLLCIEPAEGMRIGFEKKLREMTKEQRGETVVEVMDGAFDKITGAQDASVDMVIAAQAFHWVGKDGTSAITEISRVLKPSGNLVLIWNLEDRRTEWIGQLRDLYEKYESGTPQYRHGYWKQIFTTPIYESSFSPPQLTTYERKLSTKSELVIDRVLSKSFITAQKKDVQDQIVADCRKVVARGDGLVWLDQKLGTFEYPYTTDCFVMTRK